MKQVQQTVEYLSSSDGRIERKAKRRIKTVVSGWAGTAAEDPQPERESSQVGNDWGSREPNA